MAVKIDAVSAVRAAAATAGAAAGAAGGPAVAYDAAAVRAVASSAAAGAVATEDLTLALTLALGALPAPDFHLCTLLLPAPSMADATVTALRQAEEALTGGRFGRFWSSAAAADSPLQAALARAPGVIDRIRAFILTTLARTYSRIDAATLAASLGLVGDLAARVDRHRPLPHRRTSCRPTAPLRPAPQADPRPLAVAAGWSVGEGGVYIAPVSADNTPRGAAGAAGATLKYSDVASLVHTLSK